MAMTQRPLLSKTRFISGSQCHLRLWNDTHARELASEPSATLQAIFATGQVVGELACERHLGGRLIAQDHRHTEEALKETAHALDDETCPALFEAAFVHRGVLVRADIIERLPEGGWKLIEVKSGTRAKEVFVQDLAIQVWVLQGAGLDLRDAGVLTLNRDYVYDGKHLDLGALFQFHPLMQELEQRQESPVDQVDSMLSMLGADDPPNIAPGNHCFTPYRCPYYAHCTRDLVALDHPIEELPRLSAGASQRLHSMSILEVAEIPEDFPLNLLQSVVRKSVQERRPIVHGDIQGAFSELTAPIHHLDFETFAPAIPRFAGTRPFDAIPFLFSVHREEEINRFNHVDYLHETEDDPRPILTEKLIAALGQKGSICTYSGYERRVIRSLSEALPEYANALEAIQARLFDLLELLRGAYYHPEFHGSFSIKQVLPVLCPELNYQDLSIEDGQSAAVQYMLALEEKNPQVRQRIFKDIRAYCERDTLAMVKVKEALADI